ncbi:MAG: hypothetical protein E6Q97_29590 [Desulfurellales bacterium]|nr:MAG: hypothetical protein E6Q97_29590 [Desulfurellales bacterium]
MDTTQLLIPPRLRVGFQERTGTYTGKLAYVIYYDTKGTLRKEKSWQSWRSSKIDPVEFDNTPTEGFVLNKGVGGQRQSWGWHARNEYVRVYDPRDFEFEISVANLLFILREGTCHPGKGLDGKFVYAWAGTELVLLPVTSLDYQQSTAFTARLDRTVKAKELVPGYTYQTKRSGQWVYLGKFDYYYQLGDYFASRIKPGDTGKAKKHVFAQCDEGKWDLVYEDNPRALADVVSTQPPDNFAELVELHTRSARGSRIVRLFLRGVGTTARGSKWRTEWNTQIGNDFAEMATDNSDDGVPRSSRICASFCVIDGILHVSNGGGLYAYHPNYTETRWANQQYWPSWKPAQPETYKPVSPNLWIEPTNDQLFALLECGVEVPINTYTLSK